MVNPADLRKEYALSGMGRADLAAEPFEQFKRWFENAVAEAVGEPNAMTLATADAGGFPSARIVLLKGHDSRGFCFYTNYESRKGRELAENPRASLVFHWQNLERQILIQGRIEKMARAETLAYFHSRPRGSQLGACVSAQSQIIPSRAFLEQQLDILKDQYVGLEIPLPANWGGYRLVPSRFEFWQGRRNRLHDRFQYLLTDQQWQIDRLSP